MSKREVYNVVRIRPLTNTLQSKQVLRVFGSYKKAESYLNECRHNDNRAKYDIEFG